MQVSFTHVMFLLPEQVFIAFLQQLLFLHRDTRNSTAQQAHIWKQRHYSVHSHSITRSHPGGERKIGEASVLAKTPLGP